MTRTYIPQSLRQRVVAELEGGKGKGERGRGKVVHFPISILQSPSDPLTGERVPLFHPRRQQWREHFCWSEDGSEIIGLTPMGRATVAALNMNHLAIVEARRRWARVGWHPPQEDM